MTYRGHIKDGQVVLDDATALAEGTPVEVVVPEALPVNAGSIWDDLIEFSGKGVGLPADFAKNHDHYIHGTPKRERQ